MQHKTVLITGCSTGIGYATAKYLNSLEGYTVISSCRQDRDVERLSKENLACIKLDLNDSESIRQGFNEALSLLNGKLEILINNGAYAEAGAVEDLSRDQMRKQFEINLFGLLELTNLAIPIMRQQKSGFILNIGSILGHVAIPYKGAYNASKFALEGLNDTLRLELKNTGIKVVILDPGPVRTHFRQNALKAFTHTMRGKNSAHQGIYEEVLKKSEGEKLAFSLSSESLAKKIHRIIINPRPKARYYTTLPAHLLAYAKRLFTTPILDKILAKII